MSYARPTLTTRLALVFAASLVGLTVLSTAAVLVGYAVVLHHRVDARLERDAEVWAPRLVATRDGPQWATPADRAEADDTPARDGPFLRLLGANGRVRWASRALEPWPPLPDPVRALTPVTQSRRWAGTFARSRMVSVGADGAGGWIEMTRFETDPHTGVWTLVRLLLAGFIASALAAALLGQTLARRALRPVRDLHQTAEAVGAGTLDRRIPVAAGARDELADLARTFNGMLDRVEAAFERERRFTADAAHELRTPLARMRAEAELALRALGPDGGGPDPRPAFHALLGEVDGLAALVDGLLRDARGDVLRAAAPVDLTAVCRRALDRADVLAQARGVRLTGDVEPGLVVLADRAGIEEAVENVLANALKYTLAGGTVDLRLRREGAVARLAVVDSGVGFEPEEAERAFERFYRSDRPAVQAQSGAGLGLALVRDVAEGAGGWAWVESTGADRGSCVEVALPLAL